MNENIVPDVTPDVNDGSVKETDASASDVSEKKEIEADIISITEDEEAVIEESENKEKEKKPKKKRILQTPVIISICLVLAVLLTYFVYISFFLREPEGVVWTVDIPLIDSEGNTIESTYYFEFDNDNNFSAYMGSIEIQGKYNKEKNTDKGNLLTVNSNAVIFEAKTPVEYEVTGSRILNNQELHILGTDENGDKTTVFTLKQSKCELPSVELPDNFKADEKLLGEWVAMDMGTEIYRVNFNDNGSMTLKFIDEYSSYIQTYNGSYTIEDGIVNFTFYTTSSNIATPLEYSFINDDTLFFFGAYFVRADSMATVDEAAK